MQITIYTDGACSGNPGTGGWGAILMDDNSNYKEIYGSAPLTTNNRMELLAVISALSALKRPSDVRLYSDSAYVVNAIKQQWLTNWKSNFWMTGGRKPVANKDLWMLLDDLLQRHVVEFIKVKGHADNQYNNRCDLLARAAIKSIKE